MRSGELAVWAAHEQWRMEQLAYDIARGSATGAQCREAASVFEGIAERLRGYAAELDGVEVVDGDVDG
ncbi:hypothetical protein FHR84_000722 [Actinopolyspora biskrensis]|uniref:Uncharacterized protein n=1 Tax=Actinopolyspora biskrensis TaxID=1470178 RepID=A0A852YTX5_9ACTN|nr:hypothetical protein [Actinopolyspora biskrensis]NYH77408.1 hypothetical protein [Actinopolyspora biskrensis]